MLTGKELEDIKAKFDYCIISTKNIVSVDDWANGWLEVTVEQGEDYFGVFVNSDYFRSWGSEND